MKPNQYNVNIEWTGNQGSGTFDYRSYKRSHIISHPEKDHNISGSSDPAYLGNSAHYNPEELLVASIANCFMLWYLSLCSKNGVVVTHYEDSPTGILSKEGNIEKMTQVTLNPKIAITQKNMENKALELITTAHKHCYIANSVNFEITHNPTIKFE